MQMRAWKIIFVILDLQHVYISVTYAILFYSNMVEKSY